MSADFGHFPDFPDPPIPPELAVDEDEEPFTADEFAAVADEFVGGPAALAEWTPDDDTDLDPATGRVARWRVDGDGSAQWAMAHLAQIRADRTLLAEQAGRWARKIEQWFTQATRPLDTREKFFDAHLRRYALAERERTGGKRMTVVLPSGRVSTTDRSPKVKLTDEAAVIDWAKTHLSGTDRLTVIKPSESVLVGGLRKVVKLVEVPTRVVVAPCGCTFGVDWVSTAGLAGWAVGSEVVCVGCHDAGLIGRWVETTVLARDANGDPVPGVEVDMGGVTAKATPL